jgi:hypothetical protein
METVYIETTIVSYLAAEASRDLVTAGQQQATRDWWQFRRGSFQCVTSGETLAEAARGDSAMARRRLALLAGWPILTITAVTGNCRRFAHRWSLWETRRMNSNPILEVAEN